MRYPELAKGIRHLRRKEVDRIWVKRLKDMEIEEQKKAKLNNLFDNVENLMGSMTWSAEQAMVTMQIPDTDKVILL